MRDRFRRIGFVIFVTSLAIFQTSVGWTENSEVKSEKAIFAGGCFWCIEAAMELVSGVTQAVSGYTAGETKNPTYEEVSSGDTGHYEAVEVTYDPQKVSYGKLLETFWQQIDPTDTEGQFADRGSQYKTAIFYLNDKQRKLAEESKKKLEVSGLYKRPIVTQILQAGDFYTAEEYHQGYYQKNPQHYKQYKFLSGREPYLQNIKQMKEKNLR
jgi:peptide methionine sulfoxide reductase msrA/msrB